MRHHENAQRAVCGNASGAPARMNFRVLTGGSGGGSGSRCRCQHVFATQYVVLSCKLHGMLRGWVVGTASHGGREERSGRCRPRQHSCETPHTACARADIDISARTLSRAMCTHGHAQLRRVDLTCRGSITLRRGGGAALDSLMNEQRLCGADTDGHFGDVHLATPAGTPPLSTTSRLERLTD